MDSGKFKVFKNSKYKRKKNIYIEKGRLAPIC